MKNFFVVMFDLIKYAIPLVLLVMLFVYSITYQKLSLVQLFMFSFGLIALGFIGPLIIVFGIMFLINAFSYLKVIAFIFFIAFNDLFYSVLEFINPEKYKQKIDRIDMLKSKFPNWRDKI